jgi:hypothetical protein
MADSETKTVIFSQKVRCNDSNDGIVGIQMPEHLLEHELI